MQHKQFQYNKLCKMNTFTAIIIETLGCQKMRVMLLKSYTKFLNYTIKFATNVAKAQDNVYCV